MMSRSTKVLRLITQQQKQRVVCKMEEDKHSTVELHEFINGHLAKNRAARRLFFNI